MHNLHSCGATWPLMRCTMEPYLTDKKRIARPRVGRKGNEHVGCNHQLPPRVEALQREPEGTHSARRPRTGRYRHHPVGHSAHRLGQRSPREALTANAPAEGFSRKAPASAGALLLDWYFRSSTFILRPIYSAERRARGLVVPYRRA